MISLNFLLAHVVHVSIVVVLCALLPLYVISVENPVAEGLCEAESKYHVKCGLFQAKAVDYKGNTVCTGTCSNVLQRVNTGECEPLDAQQDPCKAW